MSKTAAAAQQKPTNAQPFTEAAKPNRSVFDFDIPVGMTLPDPENGDEIVAGTTEFGILKTITLKTLTVLEEKHAISRAKGDNVQLGYELGFSSIYEVANLDGEVHRIQRHDASLDRLLNQMHPKIRTMVVLGYGEVSNPTKRETDVFSQSRRIRV